VYAVLDGTVIHARPRHGFGNLVIIRHSSPDVTTAYAHLDSLSVQQGDAVRGGQVIGTMGNTAEGPDGNRGSVRANMGVHLHFSIQRVPAGWTDARIASAFSSRYEERRDIQIEPRRWLADKRVALAREPYVSERHVVAPEAWDRAGRRPPFESAPLAEEGPSYLVQHIFLGNTLQVNPVMAERLTDAERAIRAAYDALGPDHASRVHFGGGQKTLGEWADILSGRGWRPGSSTSKHASGSAVDLNYAMQPYIVTRSTVSGRTTLGGEAAGAGLVQERQHAAEVYDRAVRFTSNAPSAMSLTATMHVRASGESTSVAYRRLLRVSQAMNQYFRYALLETPTQVRRAPIANIETATEAELLAAIPLTERRGETQAVGDLDALMGTRFSGDWARAHTGWGLTPRQTYFRILRDYEHARIPWVIGPPVARPPVTRNPTRGFLHMIEPVVVALADTGRLRWGAIDFGPTSSGDVHHFDLGNHGGYTPDGSR